MESLKIFWQYLYKIEQKQHIQLPVPLDPVMIPCMLIVVVPFLFFQSYVPTDIVARPSGLFFARCLQSYWPHFSNILKNYNDEHFGC